MNILVMSLSVLVLFATENPNPTAAENAERLIQEGLVLRRQNADEEALPKFRRAYEISPTPRAAAQLGFSEQSVASVVDAESHLQEALAKGAQDPWVIKHRITIEKSLANVRTRIARVEVIGEPVGAHVVVNGREVGTFPLAAPVRVAAGVVRIEVAASEHKSSEKSVPVAAGQFQSVLIRLQREVSPVRVGPAVTDSRTGYDTLLVQNPAIEQATEETPSRPPRRLFMWGALAGAGAAGVVAGYGYTSYQSRFEAFDGSCRQKADGTIVDVSGAASTSCRSMKGRYESARTIAIAGGATAAVLGVTAAVLFLTEPEKPSSPAVAFAAVPLQQGAWASALLTF